MWISSAMAFFVKVIPPSKRARIHDGSCTFCRDGQGQENRDKGDGPTYWKPAFAEPGFAVLAEVRAFMGRLGPLYSDTGPCAYCMGGGQVDRLSAPVASWPGYRPLRGPFYCP